MSRGWVDKPPSGCFPVNSNALNRNATVGQPLHFPEWSWLHLPSVTLWIFALLKK